MTDLTYAERYARETLALTLHGQTRRSNSVYESPLWQQLSPEQREGWRQEADKFVAEQEGDATAVTKDQTRKLERWEGALLAVAFGLDPEGYHDAKDHRAGRDIASYFQDTQPYDYKLTDEVLLNAYSHADALGLDMPAFPTDAFSPQAVEKVSRRVLTDWEAAVMAVSQKDHPRLYENYKFSVPYAFRFTDETLGLFTTKIEQGGGRDVPTARRPTPRGTPSDAPLLHPDPHGRRDRPGLRRHPHRLRRPDQGGRSGLRQAGQRLRRPQDRPPGKGQHVHRGGLHDRLPERRHPH
uniref:Uncharacterized protein n=1 Tax=Caulobacter phage BL57 TaxID=3348355 RepID=A0AB74UN36_9VIRU